MSYQFRKNRPIQTRFDYESKIEQSKQCKRLRSWVAGAIFGLAGAFVFPLVVGLLAQMSAGDLAADPILQTLTSISALSIIPLLIFGGYCLTKAVERATPEEFGGCSRGLLPETKKDQTLQLAVVFMLVCGAFVKVNAQQTVFNVPTTDVLDKETTSCTLNSHGILTDRGAGVSEARRVKAKLLRLQRIASFGLWAAM